MSAGALVTDLQSRGVTLEAAGNQIRCRGRLSAADRALIRTHKKVLLEALAPAAAADEVRVDHTGLPCQPCARCRGCHFWLDAAGWHCSNCRRAPRPFQGETCCIPPGGRAIIAAVAAKRGPDAPTCS